MANYAYLLALSGFRYDARSNSLWIAPRVFSDDFQCFFSVEDAWGTIRHDALDGGTVVTVDAVEGSLRVARLISGHRETDVNAVATPGEPLTICL
jgi:hypothetical protein